MMVRVFKIEVPSGKPTCLWKMASKDIFWGWCWFGASAIKIGKKNARTRDPISKHADYHQSTYLGLFGGFGGFYLRSQSQLTNFQRTLKRDWNHHCHDRDKDPSQYLSVAIIMCNIYIYIYMHMYMYLHNTWYYMHRIWILGNYNHLRFWGFLKWHFLAWLLWGLVQIVIPLALPLDKFAWIRTRWHCARIQWANAKLPSPQLTYYFPLCGKLTVCYWKWPSRN